MSTMYRIRRYRVFIALALICTLTIYHLSRSKSWQNDLKSFDWKVDKSRKTFHDPLPPPEQVPDTIIGTSSTDTVKTADDASGPSAFDEPEREVPPLPPLDDTTFRENHDLPILPQKGAEESKQLEHELNRLGMKPSSLDQSKPHWKPQRDHFEIRPENLQSLPIGAPKVLNKVQADFRPETDAERKDRLQKQLSVKEAFKHAWNGYAKFAMPHDELKPYTRETADPFNGWGATMVDALDSLWIMGLKDEFEQAVREVSKIDFTTSIRQDIPLFETVIRYLGGLVSAYDVSTAKYPVLLDKAVELADVLMGVFDTPNRMPVTYFNWDPAYTSQPHRAGTNIVLAELGSLSVEFTRLAQITKEAKFYDAIARITDALELWQMNTTMPGLWPVRLDGSGCKRTQPISNSRAQQPGLDLASQDQVPKPAQPADGGLEDVHKGTKRQLDDLAQPLDQEIPPPQSFSTSQKQQTPAKDGSTIVVDTRCETQGLAAEPDVIGHIYSIGALADSTYEYFPKEYMLLGGLNDQYRSMYLSAMNTVRSKLLYRPMTRDANDILFVASAEYSLDQSKPLKMKYEGSHLGCFAGGMFALGSRVFNLPDDMKVARQLTDGCVWAYDSTVTGIMPELFLLANCDTLEPCAWNQTRYNELLDPQRHVREHAAKIWDENQKAIAESLAGPMQTPLTRVTEIASKQDAGSGDSKAPSLGGSFEKRQLDYSDQARADAEPPLPEKQSDIAGALEQDSYRPSKTSPQLPQTRKKIVSHKEYVEARIRDERLPSSFVSIMDREYKLRPEAIESVFIMYRLTGDNSWREKGWRMFDAIQQHTQTVDGNSAISDVTSSVPQFKDSMESFWLAETLKYFYLLFSEPDVISLDDYVLNTEAHPLRIPK